MIFWNKMKVSHVQNCKNYSYVSIMLFCVKFRYELTILNKPRLSFNFCSQLIVNITMVDFRATFYTLLIIYNIYSDDSNYLAYSSACRNLD